MKIKRDRYRKARGGKSQIYKLFCSKCGEYLLTYQKDGNGTMLRLYLDRIIEKTLNQEINLSCSKCANLIGIPMVYKSEARQALRLIKGSFSKKRN